MSQTTITTRTEFEYTVVCKFSEYSGSVADRLMLTEIPEMDLKNFKVAEYCVEIIRDYFRVFDGETPPTNDDNRLNKADIQNKVRLYNNILNTNLWYDFPEDN